MLGKKEGKRVSLVPAERRDGMMISVHAASEKGYLGKYNNGLK
jgi:hypothetical protein